MKLRVLAVGKLKNAGLEGLAADYSKRCRPFFPLELVTVRSLDALRSKAGTPRVVLDERGEQIDTLELSRWLADWRERGASRVDFLIGDAHGFSDEDRKEADRVLALSRLTLPHRFAQLLLVEQLYRASTVLAGHPYHHA